MTRSSQVQPASEAEIVEAAFLEALDGVSYITSAEGVLLAAGGPRWNAVARDANCPDCAAERMIGRSIFAHITDPEVAAVYRRLHSAVLADMRCVAYEYRCDSPGVRRSMRMAISALLTPGREPRLLYQSQVLSAVERPWMSLFEPARILQSRAEETALPIVRLCSFCHAVLAPGRLEAEGWVSPEVYYQGGGASEVRVSHGVCPGCSERMDELIADPK